MTNMPTIKPNITKTPIVTEQTTNFSTAEETKDGSSKYNLSKFEYDLFHEEDDKIEKLIRVKRLSMPNKGDRWKIFENDKVTQIIDGNKLTKKEREFLKSVDGAIWLLSKAKIGIKSFSSFKKELKEKFIKHK